jgi:hypothetical protein
MNPRPLPSVFSLAAMIACNQRQGFASHVALDASTMLDAGGDVSEEGPPVVEVTLPVCPTSPLVMLPAGTDPTSMVDVRLSGPCTRLCALDPTIPCNDAGVEWSTSTLCSCLGGAGWSCASDYPLLPGSCGAPPYACPTQPLLYSGADGGAQVLPSGACNSGESCTLRARQQCGDGTTGITSGYACECPQTGAGFGRWQCAETWATLVQCDGGVADSGSAVVPDAGGYGIEVRGDGDPYVMTGQLLFSIYAPSCSQDSTLTGCLAAGTAPCITTDVTPGNHGNYVDRQGNTWTLTSTSFQPGGVGGSSADGIVVVTAVANGATMQLTLTFHTPYEAFVC